MPEMITPGFADRRFEYNFQPMIIFLPMVKKRGMKP
jgi:hypothetical protein